MVAFFIIAALLVTGSLGVILLREPVHAALSLVATLLSMAAMYVTMDAHFLAAIQVIVYTGAVMVLFLFVLMLLNVRQPRPTRRWPWLPPAAALLGLAMVLVVTAAAVMNPQQLPALDQIRSALQGGAPEVIGESLFSDYILAFQLVGVLLLVGIIGAVSLVQRSPAPAEEK